ncbi:MAG: PSD1 and planctomycete cytochrome C domain-containing protein [Acidobacteria bacterium]|nr:PSD1 and planctomycete cytochrome C domain-containing protein [Acidobacteriota bacterium]
MAPLAIVSGWGATRPPQEIDRSALPPPARTKVDFKRDIEPIFRERCQGCHGTEKQTAGLRLDNRTDALAGGYSGLVIRPGNSAESKLVHLVAGLGKDLAMPFVGERLTAEQVGMLRAWIDQGAEWPETPKPAHQSAEPQKVRPKTTHWAFIPPQRPQILKVRNRAWVRNPVDAFVLAKLEAEGIEPSPEADRTTLIRRASLDLIGLPPTPEDVDQFRADNRPDAYESLVDRLLASPHYGEKWARQWLDLARYADSDGYELDGRRPHPWRWRHWVIDALNKNMPFDQFTVEQLAGDLLPNATVEQKVATGFHRNSQTNRDGAEDREEFRVEQVVDRCSTVGTVWLGLTVGCARCHDHKYDPITQKEFYQLYAFFNSAIQVDIEAPLAGEMGPYLQGKPEYDRKRQALLDEYKAPELAAEWEKKLLEVAANPGADFGSTQAWRSLGTELDGGHDIIRLSLPQRTQKQQDKLTDHFIRRYGQVVGEQRYKELKFKDLLEKLAKLAEEYPGLTEAETIAQNPNPPKTHLLIRGDFRQAGIEVEPDTPAVLPPLASKGAPARLTLARWLVSKDNPLTARVMVSRMWQEFFGRGLVETSDNFGTRGDIPSHPELLDWLATEFMANDWNVKKMHKLIVESATYRQSSKTRKELHSRDPYNKLLARQSRLRLPAELIRDLTLAASGLLNPAVGGKSVRPPLPAGVADPRSSNQGKESKAADRYRRGLYTFFQRTAPYPQLMIFDAPDSLMACSRRQRSTTPLQALNLLNDPVFFEAAQGLAARILRERAESASDRIDYAFRLCLARAARPHEKDHLIKYYQQQREILARDAKSADALFPAKSVEGVDPAEAAAWVGLSSVLLNLDAFITRW